MSIHVGEPTEKDIHSLSLIDEVLEDNIYKVQLGLSLSALGVKPEIAFSDYFENMERIQSLHEEIESPLVKEMASMKMLLEINRFSEKLNQLL